MCEARHKAVVSTALALLLLVAQWTGVFMVLCVSGAGHVQFELMNGGCCLPESSSPAIDAEARASCAGCTDMPLESASFWDSARRQADAGTLDAACVASDLARAAIPEARIDAGCARPAALPSILAAPLRC